jgi:hypothetical protein
VYPVFASKGPLQAKDQQSHLSESPDSQKIENQIAQGR